MDKAIHTIFGNFYDAEKPELLSVKYPWFAGGQMLHLAHLYKTGSKLYEKQLFKTALLVSDRKLLKEFMDEIDIHEFPHKNAESELIPEIEEVALSNNSIQIEFLPNEIIEEKIELEPIIDNEIASIEEEIMEVQEIELTPSIIVEVDDFEEDENQDIEQNHAEEEEVVIEQETKAPIENKETISFLDWLDQLKKKANIKEEDELEKNYKSASFEAQLVKEASRVKNDDVRILAREINQKVERVKRKISPLLEDDIPVSDTLARIYESQGQNDLALKVYHKLALIYPDKLVYFAGRIEKIKNKNK